MNHSRTRGGKPTAWLDEINDHSSDDDISPGPLIIDTAELEDRTGDRKRREGMGKGRGEERRGEERRGEERERERERENVELHVWFGCGKTCFAYIQYIKYMYRERPC